MFKKLLLIPLVAILVVLFQFSARADFINLNIGVPDSGLTGFIGPYATVNVDRTSSTTADITFTSLTSGSIIYLLGGAQSVDLNVNGGFSVGTVTGSNAGTGFTTPSYTVNIDPHNTVDGFGNFNLQIDNADGYTHSANKVTFTLTSTLASGWASAADVLTTTDNGKNFEAAAHIYPASPLLPDAHVDTYTGKTGFAANGGRTTGNGAPDGGATAVLLGLGMLGLGWVRRCKA